MTQTVYAKPTPAVKGHITLDRDGQTHKRSVLMLQSRALAFAKCQQANRNILRAEAVRSNRALGPECWYVQWIPANPDRADEMTESLQLDRVRRAEDEADAMSFVPMSDRPGLYYCVHDKGEGKDASVYEVDSLHRECTCPDFQFRCLKAGMSCKHQISLTVHLAAEKAEQEASRLVRREALRTSAAYDFA
jgi:hypothetical protein